MKYLPTAFANLDFAWKLYNYGLDGNIDLQSLDIPLTFADEGAVLVLPDRIFTSEDELILALQNNLGIAFGAAAITLNRACEEAGFRKPSQITSETDQCIALIYQIRNAFAHDIAEPRWEIRNQKYRRIYKFDGILVDLSSVHGKQFCYQDIGGPDVLKHIKKYIEDHLLSASIL